MRRLARNLSKTPLPSLPRELVLKVENQPIVTLQVNNRNARTHNDKQITVIGRSLTAFGFVNPLLVDDENIIIAGHGRLAAAKQLGFSEVPTIRLSHLNEAEKRAYAIADNQLATLAGWDDELLALELAYLDKLEIDFDITITGFETAEIDLRIESIGNDSDDAAGAIPVITPECNPVTQIGDIWQLGPHRIICGDATTLSVYEHLFENERADVCISDPPYNVKINGHVSGLGRIKHREFVMGSGEMSSKENELFLTTVLLNQKTYSQPGTLNFTFIDWRHVGELIAAGKDVYGDPINICVWVKDNGGMGSLYRSQHEFVVVFKHAGASHQNNVQLGRTGRYRTNVWNYAGANSFGMNRMEGLAMHPTVKPVPLIMDAIKDVSKRGDIVLDCFLGSGTTLIAAHKTGRRCYSMELDPLYVDTSIRRWQAYTGEEAIHRKTGRSFTEFEKAANTAIGERADK